MFGTSFDMTEDGVLEGKIDKKYEKHFVILLSDETCKHLQ